eukprot:jgi/Psemu1/5633/gm1.5633_g
MASFNRQQKIQLQLQQPKRRRRVTAPACPPATHPAVLLLLLVVVVVVVLPAVWVPVLSLRTPASIGAPLQRCTTNTNTNPATSLGGSGLVATMIPRGGSDSGNNKSEAKKKKQPDGSSVEEEETETEAETEEADGEEIMEEEAVEIVEEVEAEVEDKVEEVEAEVEEIVEEVDEETEEIVEEVDEETEGAADVDVAAQMEAEEVEEEIMEVVEDASEVKAEEDEVADVYPTDEIPSDYVRSFHTTDGELADDEGIYTDGQNESPISVGDSEDEEESQDIENATEAEAEEDSSVPAQAPITKSETPTASVNDAADDDNDNGAAVPAVMVIDEETKRVLISELRYTAADVSQLRPEIAAEVVRNKLAKPVEGMPPSFYIDPSQRQTQKRWSRKNIVLSVVGVVALSAGATALKDQENDLGEALEEFVDALKGIPEKIVALVAVAKSSLNKTETKPSTKTAVSEALDEDNAEDSEGTVDNGGNEVATEEDTNVHSIRPGTKPEEIPDPDVDKTWLDKMLTAIERSINAFLSIKI